MGIYKIKPGHSHHVRHKENGRVKLTKLVAGDEFELPDARAVGIRDKVICLSKDEQTIETAKDIETVPPYSLRHVGGGRYNVLNAEGQAVNEKPLTRAEANALVESSK